MINSTSRLHFSARQWYLGPLKILVFLLLFQSVARGWGSYEVTEAAPLNFNTHAVIDKLAFSKLSVADAAIMAVNKFPKLDDIQFREGNSLLPDGSARGPDSPGGTDFSDHYYNPYLKEGRGPWAVEREFISMLEARTGKFPLQEARAAAWAAHFLADMSVPYHVVGASIYTLSNLWLGVAENAPVPLADDLLGRADLIGSYPGGIPADLYHREMIGRFMDSSASDNAIDYFDPWYWNGDQATWFKTSSHIIWEGMVSHDANYAIDGYSSNWRNASQPTFDRPWVAQAAQARLFAVTSALNTRARTPDWIGNRKAARDSAIQDVYTMWRASVSGLKADYYINPASGSDNILRYELRGLPGNLTEETAQGVQMRFTIKGGRLVEGEEVQHVGDLKPFDATAASPRFVFEVTSPGNCLIKLEIIGKFEKTPDLQYSVMEIPFKTALDAAHGSMAFNLNFAYIRTKEEGVEEGTDFWGNGQPVTMPKIGSLKFGVELPLDNQQVALNFDLDPSGTRIKNLAMSNKVVVPVFGGEYRSEMTVNYHDIPLRLSYNLGAEIWIYGFWVPRGGHAPFIGSTAYDGKGQYDERTDNPDGSYVVKRHYYQVAVKEYLWASNFIYIELINKTPEQIAAIIAGGAITQEAFNTAISNYAREFNRAMGW